MKQKGLTMTRCTVRWLGVILVTLSPCHLVTLSAQEEAAGEIQWRTDYNAARREAEVKNKPLVLDFGTENCYWCKRLDTTTFRDPAVMRLINASFIPLRIDAEQEANLTQLLRIQSYPTLVMAAADGKILCTQEGYLDASRFLEKLQRCLATISNPEWMTRDYQDAVKAIGRSDYPRAIALLRSVTEDGKDRPVQLKARQALKDLEQQAAERLARARQFSDQGQTTEAVDTLTELVRVFGGTQAATEGGELLTSLGARKEIKTQQRTRRARELLAQAREDYRTEQYLCCLDRCEVLAASYGDLPEGEEARLLRSEIMSNPAWMQTACESLSDRLGTLYLALAETWLQKGQPQQAVQCLERVVKTFPSSRQAEVAQVRLTQLRGKTERTTFKKSEKQDQ
jgi:thioredoxin-related protein